MTNKKLSTSTLYEPEISSVLQLVDEFSDNFEMIVEGLAIEELEKNLCDYHKSKYCISFSSGFWALAASIIGKSIEGRNEIIVPSLTYRRLDDVVYWTKHCPVFVDIEISNLAISPNSVREAINKNTALILAVHPIINCCKVKELIDISMEYGIPIIFDAVESVHETYMGKRIGSFDAEEVFSLHVSKLLNGVEGGYICTNDEEFYKKMIKLRSNLVSEDSLDCSIDSRPNDIHAIFALASLKEINKNISHNKKIYTQYKSLLSNISNIRLLEFDEFEQTSYNNIVIELLNSSMKCRDALVCELNEKNILARSYYFPLHMKNHDYKTITRDMTNTEFVATKYINLPSDSRMTDKDVERVCSLIKDFINND
jgi:dTDP-4-amino-4,6-dideoxygalactose transaminase